MPKQKTILTARGHLDGYRLLVSKVGAPKTPSRVTPHRRRTSLVFLRNPPA